MTQSHERNVARRLRNEERAGRFLHARHIQPAQGAGPDFIRREATRDPWAYISSRCRTGRLSTPGWDHQPRRFQIGGTQLFWHQGRLCGRQFFRGLELGVGRMVLGRFKPITFIVHFISIAIMSAPLRPSGSRPWRPGASALGGHQHPLNLAPQTKPSN